jgi:hypothetical protein
VNKVLSSASKPATGNCEAAEHAPGAEVCRPLDSVSYVEGVLLVHDPVEEHPVRRVDVLEPLLGLLVALVAPGLLSGTRTRPSVAKEEEALGHAVGSLGQPNEIPPPTDCARAYPNSLKPPPLLLRCRQLCHSDLAHRPSATRGRGGTPAASHPPPPHLL